MSRIAMLNGLGGRGGRRKRRSRRSRRNDYSYPMHGSMASLGAAGDGGMDTTTIVLLLAVVGAVAYTLTKKKTQPQPDVASDSGASVDPAAALRARYSSASARSSFVAAKRLMSQ